MAKNKNKKNYKNKVVSQEVVAPAPVVEETVVPTEPVSTPEVASPEIVSETPNVENVVISADVETPVREGNPTAKAKITNQEVWDKDDAILALSKDGDRLKNRLERAINTEISLNGVIRELEVKTGLYKYISIVAVLVTVAVVLF